MNKPDKRFRTDGRTRRVIHVPLTDAEWKALGARANEKGQTKGDLTSVALQRTYKLGVAS